MDSKTYYIVGDVKAHERVRGSCVKYFEEVRWISKKEGIVEVQLNKAQAKALAGEGLKLLSHSEVIDLLAKNRSAASESQKESPKPVKKS